MISHNTKRLLTETKPVEGGAPTKAPGSKSLQSATVMDMPVGSAPKVSVIIVTYESGREIERCLTALKFSQMLVEPIVIDNGSSDGSLGAARSALRTDRFAQVIDAGQNLGFAKAVNLGIARARGEFVLLLNPDCYVQPDTIRHVLAVLTSTPNAGMAGCLLLNRDGTEQAGCRRYIPTPWRAFVRILQLHRLAAFHPRFNGFLMNHEALPDAPTSVEAISGAFMMARTDAIKKVGLMDEGYFMHCEDLDWCTRFKQAGWDVLFVPTALAVHDKGRSSTRHPVRVELYKHWGMIRFYRKFFRKRYSLAILWIVTVAVGLRFLVRATMLTARRTLASASNFFVRILRPSRKPAT